MQAFYFLMMLAGWAAVSFGFYLMGEKVGRLGWAGAVLLFAGIVLAFLGVLLAFVPRFFA